MFANSKKQTLAMHSIGVANVALELYLQLNFQQSTMKKKSIENIDAFKKSIFFAGLFHDIGKIDPNFQEFINKKDVTDANGEAVDGVHFIDQGLKWHL